MIELINDDCLIALTKIEENSIDITVTSPPYDNLRTYNGNNAQWGEHVWKAVIQDLYRVTKQGGVVVWVVGDATIKGSETGTSFNQALWAKECGFNLHDTMIWTKTWYAPKTHRRYEQQFEFCFVFTKGTPKTFNGLQKANVKSTGKSTGSHRQANGEMKSMSAPRRETSLKTNVWEYNPDRQRLHPAPFPEKLALDHILSWSNEGDTVLDPFMGSGTTGKMAKQLGRNFIGIEIDPTYFETAQKRINP